QSELYFDDDALWHEHYAEEIDVPFVYVRGRAYTGNGKKRVLNMVDFYRNVKKAAKEYAKKSRPDIILASSVHPLTLVAGIQLAKCFGIKCICEIRDLWPEALVAYGMAGPKNPAVLFLRRLEKWIYKKADALVFTAEGAYDYIIEQGWEKDVPRSKVHFINNGVDLETFNYNKANYQIDDKDLEDPDIFKVVYTGSIRKVNNLGLLLDIAKEVKDKRVKILVWGDGNERSVLEERIKTEKIENVIFKGRVEKKYVPYIVSHADLNLNHNGPSAIVRFGISFNKIFDYFAGGKPILCDFPCCKYNPVIECGAGMDIPDPAAKEIADKIGLFVEMPSDEYKAYCDNAEKAAQKYDFRNLTENLVSVIEKI
ncbi:MAG: glycosyltransferase family 4 protein, partial [Clostridiales bacterium]|nr:glycosyltransferase family 4 protein [Clostridiales bacterium]